MKPDAFGSRPRRVRDVLRVTAPAGLAPAVAAILARQVRGAPTSRAAPAGACGGARQCVEVSLDPQAGDAALAGLVARLQALEQAHSGSSLELEREEHLVEEDVGAVRRERFRPFVAAPGLVIRPAWQSYAPRPGETVIALDPGPAFGSGVHASTRLALALLHPCCSGGAPRRALDVGTGSGVLALAAALQGAGEVAAIDVDPEAVETAQANAALNGLAGRVRVGREPLAEVSGTFGLIVANLTAEVILGLLDGLAARLQPGGALVLSGILAGGQDAEVLEACRRRGLACEALREEGEWAALLLRRPSP